METSGLPDMYTGGLLVTGLSAEGVVHIRQTMSGHNIKFCAIATPSIKQKAALLELKIHNLIPPSTLKTLPIH